jgi:hypothetical protein
MSELVTSGRIGGDSPLEMLVDIIIDLGSSRPKLLGVIGD